MRKSYRVLAAAVAGFAGLVHRAVAATDTWIGASSTSANWGDGANWTAGSAPLAGDSLIFDGSTQTTNNNDFAAGTAFNGVTFNPGAGSFVLGGNSITLNGANVNNVLVSGSLLPNNGVFNQSTGSGVTQNVNVGLVVSPGTYAIVGGSVAGATLGINGGISAFTGSTTYTAGGSNPPTVGGGVVDFIPGLGTISTTGPSALANDTTGIIGGWAFITDAKGNVTDLAAVNSGAVSAYTGYTTVNATTALNNSASTNLKINVGSTITQNITFSNINSDGTIPLNSVVDADAGFAGQTGTATSLVIPSANTLVLGPVGAIVSTSTSTSLHSVLEIGSTGGASIISGQLTAGGPTANKPGELVFVASQQANTNNQIAVETKIVDHGTGAVSVIKSGTGSVFFAGPDTYTGGTFVNQGQLQGNSAGSFGTGPVYVAKGATVFPNQGGTTIPNAFFINPDLGDSTATTFNALNAYGAIRTSANNLTFTGTITLQGAPVTPGSGPGDRIDQSGNGDITELAGQITGPGTLELFSNVTGTSGGNIYLQNTTANPNNFTGGLVCDTVANGFMFAKLGASGQVPHGPGKGNVTMIQNGTGTLRWDPNGFSDTFNGLIGMTGSAGLLQIVDFGAGPSTLTLGDGDGNGTFAGIIAAGGKAISIVKIGNGTEAFTGVNTYNGGTTITAGVLQAGSATAYGATTAPLTINGGSADLTNNNITVGVLSGAGGQITTSSAGANPSFTAGTSVNSTYSGAINNGAGVVSFIKQGAGTLTLTGSSTSAININAGALIVSGNGTTGNISMLASTVLTLSGNSSVGNINTNSANAITVSGNNAAASVSLNGGSTLNVTGLLSSPGNISVNSSNTMTVAGGGSIGGAASVSVNSPGSLSVDGTLASSTNLTLNGGSLSGTGSVGNLSFQGGAVHPGASFADGSIGTLTASTLNVGSGDIRMDLSSPGNSDAIVVTGAANFAGGSTITPTGLPAAGTYKLLTATSLTGTPPTFNTPSTTTRTTFNLIFDTVHNDIQLGVTGSPLTITWTGTHSSSWDLNQTANFTDGVHAQTFFDLDPAVFADGEANSNINLTTALAPAAVVINNSAGNDYTFSGSAIADSGFAGGTSLTKTGAGALYLQNSNSYLGATNIKNGTLIVGSTSALPSGTTLTLGDATSGTSAVVDLAGNSINIASIATAGGSANVIGNSSTNNSSSITVNSGNTTFAGVIQDSLSGGTQTVSLSVNGGSLVLANNNTYTGGTTINPGATLQLGNGGATGGINLAGSINNNGILIFARAGTSILATNINGSGNIAINGGTTLQVDNGGSSASVGSGNIALNGTLVFDRNDNPTVSNTISGTGSLQHIGSGALLLSGNNSYTGGTLVGPGATLQFNSSTGLGTGPVTVQDGGTLDLSQLTTGEAVTIPMVTIGGTGVNQEGAIFNNNFHQENAFMGITLTDDTTIGGDALGFPGTPAFTGRYDLRTTTNSSASLVPLNLNGHTLTKNGTNQFVLHNANVSDGSIIVNGGVFSFENDTTILDYHDGNTLTFNDGTTFQVFIQTGTQITVQRPLIFNGNGGSGITMANGSNLQVNVASPISLTGAIKLMPANNASAAAAILDLVGNITETPGSNSTITVNANASSNVPYSGNFILAGNNSYSGGTTINSGTLTAASVTALGTGSVTLNGGRLVAQAGLPSAIRLPGLSVSSGIVDLNDNDLILDYTPGNSPMSTIASLLKSGYNGGAWNGATGIESTTAHNVSTGSSVAKTALGYADAADVGITTFDGQTLGAGDVLVKYTYYGDSSLDGVVDLGNDFNLFIQGFLSGGSTWELGDYNYDGQVNMADFQLFVEGFSAQGGALGDLTEVIAASPLLSSAQKAELLSVVPEPASLGLLSTVACVFAMRRRRK